ncbi:MAG: hypothetical protein Q9191_006068 [Dirinaria sp. TL-2023a]
MQLCATGTVGIAAVGLALGQRKNPTDRRSDSSKRKAPPRIPSDEPRSSPMASATVSPPPQPASAPTTRLRKRTSFGRPLSSSSRLSLGTLTGRSISDVKESQGRGHTAQPAAEDTRPSFSHEPFEFEAGGANTFRSSWLRRKSTLSMAKDESPTSTPPTGSPSISFSNRSTAPILSTTHSPSTVPRNKLVKRSSSQRALQGGNTMHSSLRRPATSHQRSATLQQQRFSDDEGPLNYRSLFQPPSPLKDLHEDQPSRDEDAELWRPFFKPKAIRLVKDGTSKKRGAGGGLIRNETLRAVVPEIDELPTLMLATSVRSRSSDDAANFRATHGPSFDTSTAPLGFNTLSTGRVQTEIYADPEPPPRKSFSLSGFFHTPSPSNWKMPRSNSLRKNTTNTGRSNGRRVVSAPQSTRIQHNAGASERNTYSEANPLGTGRRTHSSTDKVPPSTGQAAPSSPLPPLNRLSAFEIDLPGSVPSYPTSPQPQDPTTSPKLFTPPSPSASSPLGPLSFNTFRNKAHRPSGAPSDHTSTLLGSDNENSRFWSGDEDELDGRSETVYDSTRTGATGSSHSGIRRPPLDTVFNGNVPGEIPKQKLLGLQDLISHESFGESPIQRADITEEEGSVSTPVRNAAPCKEDHSPVRAHRKADESPHSPAIPSSPPDLAREANNSTTTRRLSPSLSDEDMWAFDDTGSGRDISSSKLAMVEDDDQAGMSPNSGEGSFTSPELQQRTPSNAANRTKTNIFDWSEQPSTEKDSPQGSSPRPKTVHGKNGKEVRNSRLTGRRGPSPLHLRSQSVPVPSDPNGPRGSGTASKLESWVLGNKGVSEDWDNDFEFDEPPRPSKQVSVSHEYTKSSNSTGMLVPRSILDRQASVHGQFGHVKELTLLVEELKRLQQQAAAQGIMQGPSAELWKEAEGIINLATVDDEDQEFLPPRSPNSPSFDFDAFDEDSPAAQNRRKSGISSSRGDRSSGAETLSNPPTPSQTPSLSSPEKLNPETPPPPTSRPRKESAAKAKSVLENIHQQRSRHDLAILEQSSQKKLPFDTTSLRDLVTRAGVVTRALKEIVRRAESSPATPNSRPKTPSDPPFVSQIFQQTPSSPSPGKSPRVTQSPKSGSFIGGNITGNDNDINNGHMKIMTVV